MSGPRQILTGLITVIATGFAGAALVAHRHEWSEPRLSSLVAFEVVVMALGVIPWCSIFAYRAYKGFDPDDIGARAWRVLGMGSVLLLFGNVAAYLPSIHSFGDYDAAILAAGQLLPAAFRIGLCWALWRVQRAYRATGLGFTLKPFDFVLASAVLALTAVHVARQEAVLEYWMGNTGIGATGTGILNASQLFNFALYPIVFLLSLTMHRYAAQMGGGAVARAWSCVALYGLCQPLHVFLIAVFFPVFGPMFPVAVDNFVVLTAFSSLALGPIFQIEATALAQASVRSRSRRVRS